MPEIVIAPLSTPATITSAAWRAVTTAKTLFLQTERHPSAKPVLDAGLHYQTMDDLYERAEDFDELNRRIAGRLIEAGDCVYAVTGHVLDSQLPAIQAEAGARGVSVSVLAGVSFASAAFPSRRIDRVLTAAQMPASLNPKESVAIEEIGDAILAGDAKLLLSEYYPDDWEILFATLEEDGAFRVTALPLYELDRQARYGAASVAFVPGAAFDELTRFGYREVCDVLTRLRAPDGCPWDRKQTHESLKEPLMEECYELLDAIDEGNDAHLIEELGDVLMQVVFHENIAQGQARFTERDVCTELVKKLVYRHPHIFGSVRADTAEEVLVNWDKLKRVEKEQRTQTDVLKSVPRNLPALTRAYKVQKKAANVGFDWPNAQEAAKKIAEETGEVLAAAEGDGDLAEETGDLLFSVVNVARLLHVNPELALLAASDKFVKRFEQMELLANEQGCSLEEMDLSDMDILWEKVKNP